MTKFALSFLFYLGVGLGTGSSALAQSIQLDSSIAHASCQRFTRQEMKTQLQSLLSPESVSLRILKNFFPDFSTRDLSGLNIRVENFGEDKLYRAFFTPGSNSQSGTIRLDCSLGSVLSWPSLLAHELAHFHGEDRNLSSWMQELLAQVIEVNASPYYNFERFNTLRDKNRILSFFSEEKPFQNHETYAVNMMFGLYISQNFNGSPVYKSLNRDIQTLEDFTKKLRQFTVGNSQFDWIRESLTPEHLIRHFALAMNINQTTRNGGTIYKIPGWRGFLPETLISKSGSYPVEPGGHLRLHSKYWDKFQAALASQGGTGDLSIYHIHKTNDQFRVQEIHSPIPDLNATESFMIIVNTSLSQNYLIEL